MTNSTSPPAPPMPPPPNPPRAPQKRSHFLLYGCGGILAFVLLIVATVAITVWWIQRPIKPVVLSPREKAVVDQKIQRLEGVSNSTVTGPGDKPPATRGNST